jgi:DNA-binding transcriptional ArsR family regulator
MANQNIDLSNTFHALGDPTRMAIVDRLCRGEAAVGDLARPFDMALPSFLKHIRVLEAADLVVTRKVGRVRKVAIAPNKLAQAGKWFLDRRALWDRRLDRLARYLDRQGGR